MFKILHKIDQFRKNVLLVCAYYIFKKYGGFDLVEVADIMKEVMAKLDSLSAAVQKFTDTAQRFRRSTS